MTEFSDVLRAELDKRVRRNPRYSLRAFARDVKVSPSRLSEVLSGGHAPSRSSVRTICRELGYSRERSEYLCDVVEAEHARDPVRRAMAAKRLKSAQSEPGVYEFSDDAFRSVADWYHVALVALVETSEFRNDPVWIGDRLGLTPETVVEAIDRLERLGLVEIDDDGDVSASKVATRVADGVAPEAMRTFHEQVLAKAAEAMHKQPREQRTLGATVFAVSEKAYPEMVELMGEFRRRIAEISRKYDGPSEVYAASVQLFRLTAPSPSMAATPTPSPRRPPKR